MKTILFLCTGNYYRSRFAEIFFNKITAERGINWRADSRGLNVPLGIGNVGPISPYALEGLLARGITGIALRNPVQVTENDLKVADSVIALQAEEHRPYIQESYERFEHAVEYWHVPDLDKMQSREALGHIEQNIRTLIDTLQSS